MSFSRAIMVVHGTVLATCEWFSLESLSALSTQSFMAGLHKYITIALLP